MNKTYCIILMAKGFGEPVVVKYGLSLFEATAMKSDFKGCYAYDPAIAEDDEAKNIIARGSNPLKHMIIRYVQNNIDVVGKVLTRTEAELRCSELQKEADRWLEGIEDEASAFGFETEYQVASFDAGTTDIIERLAYSKVDCQKRYDNLQSETWKKIRRLGDEKVTLETELIETKNQLRDTEEKLWISEMSDKYN